MYVNCVLTLEKKSSISGPSISFLCLLISHLFLLSPFFFSLFILSSTRLIICIVYMFDVCMWAGLCVCVVFICGFHVYVFTRNTHQIICIKLIRNWLFCWHSRSLLPFNFRARVCMCGVHWLLVGRSSVVCEIPSPPPNTTTTPKRLTETTQCASTTNITCRIYQHSYYCHWHSLSLTT